MDHRASVPLGVSEAAGSEVEGHPKPGNLLLWSLIGLMILSWAFNFIFGKVALRSFDPLTLAAFRVELAAAVMVATYLALPGRWHVAIAGAGPDRVGAGQRTRLNRGDLWNFVQLGVLGVVLNQMLFTVGLNYTSVGHASVIIGMGPIHVLWLARLFGLERITPRKLVGMFLAFGGVVLLAAEKSLNPSALGLPASWSAGTLRGDLITLTGSLAFALYTVRGKKLASQYDSLAMNLYNYLAGAIVILPLAVWRGWSLDWGAVSWQGWVGLAYMAVFASVVAYLIYYWALRHLAASRLAATSYLMPVLATLLGILLLGEKVTPNLLVGGGLVLFGVYMTERKVRKAAEETETVVVQP